MVVVHDTHIVRLDHILGDIQRCTVHSLIQLLPICLVIDTVNDVPAESILYGEYARV